MNYSSTLEDSLLTFQCDGALLPKGVFTARCYGNGSWIPNPLNHVCATSSAGECILVVIDMIVLANSIAFSSTYMQQTVVTHRNPQMAILNHTSVLHWGQE